MMEITQMLQKPMVYIKVIEIFFALVCVCCVVAFSICIEINVKCVAKNHKTVTNTTGFCIEYPYSLSDLSVQDICSDSTYPAYILRVDYDTEAEFFVAVGIISMLFALVMFLFYIRFWEKYSYTTYFPFPDLLITFALASLWFASSCSWASAVDGLSQYADFDSIMTTIRSLMSCQGKDNSCSITPDSWSYGTLVFSVWGTSLRIVFTSQQASILSCV